MQAASDAVHVNDDGSKKDQHHHSLIEQELKDRGCVSRRAAGPGGMRVGEILARLLHHVLQIAT